MRWVAIAFLSVSLSACASVTEAENNPEAMTPTTVMANELGPQTLSSGECGLFGWTTESPSRFILFATEDAGRFLDQGEVKLLQPKGAFPALIFDLFSLELGRSEPLADATRYPAARLRQTLEDGFERVQPLVILETCQTDTAP